MTTDFEAQLQTDMAECFTGSDEFEETVTVTTADGTVYSAVLAVIQEYLGAIDEKTQFAVILPIADVPLGDRASTFTRANGDVLDVIDVSQRDAAAVNYRAVLAQETC